MKQYLTATFDPAGAKPIEASLVQLLQVTSDGDLICKKERDKLVKAGWATRAEGFNIITAEGIRWLRLLGTLHH